MIMILTYRIHRINFCPCVVLLFMDVFLPGVAEMEYRLDYQLRERSMENSYVSLLTSHTAYWANRDIALFILVHLFPVLQDESPV